MSSVASPFGLKPASPPSGVIRQAQLENGIASGFAQNIFQYAPIRLNTAGQLEAALTTEGLLGVFQGVEFTRPDGRRAVANNWVSGEVATEIVAYYTYDPYIIYEIQADASIAQLRIGQQGSYTSAVGGNAITGLSNVALDVTTLANVADDLRIVGVNPAADNAIGDAFTIVQVQIANHSFQLAQEVLSA